MPPDSPDDRPPEPRHLRRLGDPVPGTTGAQVWDVLRAEVRDLVALGAALRDLGQLLARQVMRRRD
ncbi:hypothetical protein [Promicromonospora sp. NPDC050880]|uniref:hypothetical protein n=1 Tax=Promicromonospora sp. NPDC050880 TaxID=3364406 RepID=UPI003788FDC1